MKIELKDCIYELERTLREREKKYPKLIAAGKLHREHARRQYARLKKAIEILKGKPEGANKQKTLFQ